MRRPHIAVAVAVAHRRAMVLVGLALLLSAVFGRGAVAAPGDVTAVAGAPRDDCIDENVALPAPGPAGAASFNYGLHGVAVDAAGSRLYLAEARFRTPPPGGGSPNDSRIWSVSLGAGALASAAGGGARATDGPAAEADVNPKALALRANQPGRLYFLDNQVVAGRDTLLLRALEDGAVTTVQSLGLLRSNEVGLTADATGGLYYSQAGTGEGTGVYRVQGGASTVLVPGAATSGTPMAVAVDPAGTTLYVVERGSGNSDGRLLAVDLVAGGGARTLRTDLARPSGVAVDLTGSRLFVAEYGARRVVEIDPATGKTVPRAVANGLYGPTGLTVVTPSEEEVDVYVQDGDGCYVSKVERLARYVPAETPTSQQTDTTLPPGDDETKDVTVPSIPTGQAGSQTQPDPQVTPDPQPQVGADVQAQPQATPQRLPQPLADLGGSVGRVVGANPVGVGPAGQSSPVPGPELTAPVAAPSGGEGAVAPAAPPAPNPAPAPAPLVHGQTAPGGGQAAVAGDHPTLPRGATRYAMVRQEHLALAPAAALAGVGIVAFFGGALCLAARYEPRRPAPAPARSRCRAKGAY